jgi:hypothetical protein
MPMAWRCPNHQLPVTGLFPFYRMKKAHVQACSCSKFYSRFEKRQENAIILSSYLKSELKDLSVLL